MNARVGRGRARSVDERAGTNSRSGMRWKHASAGRNGTSPCRVATEAGKGLCVSVPVGVAAVATCLLAQRSMPARATSEHARLLMMMGARNDRGEEWRSWHERASCSLLVRTLVARASMLNASCNERDIPGYLHAIAQALYHSSHPSSLPERSCPVTLPRAPPTSGTLGSLEVGPRSRTAKKE